MRVDATAPLPLDGLRIVVTRPRDQAAALVDALKAAGAEVLIAPMIRIEPPSDPARLAAAAAGLDSYDWLVFTSANGVRSFLPKALENRELPSDLKICAIGAATADAVRAVGPAVDLLPKEYVAESVVEAFLSLGDMSGLKILLARAEKARAVIPDALRQKGAVVDDLPVYRTVADDDGVAILRGELANARVDLVTFTSSSAVRNFAELVTSNIGGTKVASIGPVTSAAIRELGWAIDIEATVYSAEGLVEAITCYFDTQRPA